MQVKVYRNLHASRSQGAVVYSVMDKATGRVVAHVTEITLTGVTFKVRESGRQKVLATRRKNVHAFVEGTWERGARQLTLGQRFMRVSYNPYKGPDFTGPNGRTLRDASVAFLGSSGIFCKERSLHVCAIE